MLLSLHRQRVLAIPVAPHRPPPLQSTPIKASLPTRSGGLGKETSEGKEANLQTSIAEGGSMCVLKLQWHLPLFTF